VVAAEVGRTGATTLAVDVEDRAGQESRPHARLVAQQPPPSDEGQARKPEEHVRVLCMVDVLDVVFVVVVVEVETRDVLDGVNVDVVVEVDTTDGTTTVVVVIDVLKDEEDVEVADGATITVAVELIAHPTS